MNSIRRHALFISLFLIAGCDQDNSSPIGDDGRADTNNCMTGDELIDQARAQLIQNEPSFYNAEMFAGATASVENMEDLNGDGIGDALVFPGLSYSGAIEEQVVFLSDSNGCITTFAGNFGSAGMAPSEDGGTTNGVRDLTGSSATGCDLTSTRYTFDGTLYVEASFEVENVCESVDAAYFERETPIQDGESYSFTVFADMSRRIAELSIEIVLEHQNPEGLSFILISPTGEMQQWIARDTGYYTEYDVAMFELLTLQFNGENTYGDWILEVTDEADGATGTFWGIELSFVGMSE